MERHRVSGRRGLGSLLASCTMLVWGVLPLVLEGLLERIDAITIIWFRFSVAALGLGAALGARGALPRTRQIGRAGWLLLGVATVFLGLNYLTYLLGLARTNAPSAQVLMQLATLLLALGGVLVFREHFARLQWIGFATLLLGLGLFFGVQLRALVAGLDRYLTGAGLLVLASFTWAIYGLAQKQLLTRLSSQGILLWIYLGCALLFAAGASPSRLLTLDAVGWGLLAFASASTLTAYGTFAAALEHWEASRVSVVLALTPLATLIANALAAELWPAQFAGVDVSLSAVTGACIVVLGSMLVALGGAPSRPRIAGDDPVGAARSEAAGS